MKYNIYNALVGMRVAWCTFKYVDSLALQWHICGGTQEYGF